MTDSIARYTAAFELIGNCTPLGQDCGVLCGSACCRGTDTQGMRLFPGEPSLLPQVPTADGAPMVICTGRCDRAARPLACRIFPFFPYLHTDGHISAEIDVRGLRICPLVSACRSVQFDRSFRHAVRAVGRLLAQDDAIRAFLRESSAEIDTFRAFTGFTDTPSARIARISEKNARKTLESAAKI